MMPRMKMIERIIIRGQFIGIWISGSLLFRVLFFACFNISKIRMPVSPPEIIPPIPRIMTKPMKLNRVMTRYRIKGTRDVNMKLVSFDVLMSYLNVLLRENDRTKKDVSIVKIPRECDIENDGD